MCSFINEFIFESTGKLVTEKLIFFQSLSLIKTINNVNIHVKEFALKTNLDSLFRAITNSDTFTHNGFKLIFFLSFVNCNPSFPLSVVKSLSFADKI